MSKNDVQKTADAIAEAERFLNLLHGVEWLKTLCATGIDAERNAKEESRLAIHQRDIAREEYAAEKAQHESEKEASIHQHQHDLSVIKAQLVEAHKAFDQWRESAGAERVKAQTEYTALADSYSAKIDQASKTLSSLLSEIASEEKRLAAVVQKRKELQGI